MFEIEKNIPIPGYHCKYPFEKMEIGDSFFVKEASDSYRRKVRNAANMFGKKNGCKFKTRSMKNKDGIDGIRIWRVE